MAAKEGVPLSVAVSSPVSATSNKPLSIAKSTKTKADHPPTADMVKAAIGALHERGGSSLQAIKKYIVGTYMLDGDKIAPYIRKYIKNAVTSGNLVQTKGKGASGSFKLPTGKTDASKTKKLTVKSAEMKIVLPKKSSTGKKSNEEKKPENAAKNTKKSATTATKTVAKKTLTVEKVKKPSPEKSPRTPVPKSPSKIKNVSKSPTTKPKAPKPKKIAATKNVKKITNE